MPQFAPFDKAARSWRMCDDGIRPTAVTAMLMAIASGLAASPPVEEGNSRRDARRLDALEGGGIYRLGSSRLAGPLAARLRV
jgi:hypothetical protein